MKIPTSPISRRELLKGSVVAGGLAALGSPLLSFAQHSGTSGSTAFGDLGERLTGDLITPAHEGYDQARKLWNGMVDKRPAAIARCTGVADIIEVLNYAHGKGIAVSVRGGGHNVAGKALRNGAITIDLGQMNGVRVDGGAKRVRVQGGARWAALDRETLAMDLYTTGGTVGTTGVAGLTLGGGFGWLMRKHGLSCDNVVGADVVTADGQLIIANQSENADLFWALRGGGGNFGIVTSLEFRLHEVEPMIGGIAMYPESMTRDLLQFFREYTSTAPNSVSAQAGVFVGPPGTPVEGQNAGWIAVCHTGPPGEGERLVRPIKKFGPPALDLIGPTTYKVQQRMFDAGLVTGDQNYWRSNFVNELSDGLIDAIVSRAHEIPRPGSLILLEHMGGAVSAVGEHETAFAHRGASYNLSVLGVWKDARQNEKNIAWTRNFGDELRAFATGGSYVNYMADDESAERVKAAYEANFQQLVEVKRKYDPGNFFSGNQNIVP